MNEEKNVICFVTGNDGKFREVSKLFKDANINYELIQNNIQVFPSEIQADTIKEVALFKLNIRKEDFICSFFVEDAGFFVDYPLNGFPGVYSSYVHKTIGNEGILKLIDDFDSTKAHFEAVIALYFKPLDEVHVFKGVVKGKISREMRGSGGFGFDPIFIPDAKPSSTFAELSTEEKNSLSHRGQALQKLIRFLKKNE